MYRITIHCEAEGLAWIEPIARGLGHVEIAVDALEPLPPPQRVPHPAVEVIERTKEEQRSLSAAKRKQRSDAERKARERARMAFESPRAIAAGACPTCGAAQGRPCVSPDGRQDYGMTGHTHIARRELVTS